MSLPKIDQPIYELIIPSTKVKVRYRPFLVKEEKILLMASEGGDAKSMADALKQIISNCCLDTLNIDGFASFDIEYFFLKLRSKSVSETVEMRYDCENKECSEKIEFSVDLNSIEVNETPNHSMKIELTPSVGLIMKYPTIDIIQNLGGNPNSNNIFDLIIDSIDQIYDADSIHYAKDNSKSELNAWIESLDQKSFTKIRDFFETMPKLSYQTELVCKKCNTKNKINIEGLQSFF